MSTVEKIQDNVQRLPTSVQAVVLEFVEYLLDKTERQEEKAWSHLSLAGAMRGMEDEDTPDYTASDLKLVFA